MKDLPTSVLNSRLTLLSEEKCQAIYDAALTIIAEIAMTVPHPVARELLVGAGATVEGEDLVRIPRELVAKARETVPSMIPDRTPFIGPLPMLVPGPPPAYEREARSRPARSPGRRAFPAQADVAPASCADAGRCRDGASWR